MPGRPTPEDLSSARHAGDRRAFLRGLAALGAGALGAAGTAQAAPRQLGAAAKLRRAPQANLQIRSTVPRLQVALPKPLPPELRPLPAASLPKVPAPSTRARLLKALSAGPGGTAALADAGLEPSGADGPSVSGKLQAMSHNTLAAAYGAGVVLTPTGCEYADGVKPLPKPPIFYQSWCGSLSAESVAGRVCYVHGSQAAAPDAVLWFCFITTPGAGTDKLTYLLELSINSVYSSYLDRLKFSLNLSDLKMSPTSDKTLVATVEMCGTEQQEAAYLFAIHRRDHELGSFGLNWLNVLAL